MLVEDIIIPRFVSTVSGNTDGKNFRVRQGGLQKSKLLKNKNADLIKV